MFDPTKLTRKRITLDWDFSQFSELKKRLSYIENEYSLRHDIDKINVFLSSLKGFHIEIWFKNPQLVAKVRNELKDDGVRLVKDILRSHKVHDVLWQQKTKNGQTFRQELLTL